MAAEVSRRLDVNDSLLQKGYEAWLEQRRNDLTCEPLGTVVHRFTTAALHELAVKFFLADIEENAAILRLRLAQQRRVEALTHLHTGLAEHDLFFGKEDDNVHENRLEVRRVSKAQELEYMRRVVRFSRDLVEGTAGLTPEQVAGGELPDYLKGVAIQAYTVELGEYLVQRGAPGSDAIRQICDDAEFAAQVEQDEQSPRPLRYLAQMTNSVRSPVAPKAHSIGFVAA
jgi:hypothetical protein